MVGANGTWNYGCSLANTLAGGEKELDPLNIKCNAHKPYRKENRKSWSRSLLG